MVLSAVDPEAQPHFSKKRKRSKKGLGMFIPNLGHFWYFLQWKLNFVTAISRIFFQIKSKVYNVSKIFKIPTLYIMTLFINFSVVTPTSIIVPITTKLNVIAKSGWGNIWECCYSLVSLCSLLLYQSKLYRKRIKLIHTKYYVCKKLVCYYFILF